MLNSLTADGVQLDSFASRVTVGSNRWSVPGAKGENVLTPGRHGSLWVPDKTFDEGEFSLEIVVEGATESGFVPLDQLSQVRANLDRLLRIFTRRKKLVHIEQTLENGSRLECHAECTGAFDVTRSSQALPFAKFTVGLKIPSAFWQDSLNRTYSSPGGLVQNQFLSMPEFEGGTAPMDDLIYLVHGPIATPQLYVYGTGAYTRLEDTVPQGQVWRIDSKSWSSQMGAGLTFDIDGPSVISRTSHGGSASLMDIPPLATGEPGLQISGLSMGATTRIQVRGRRKFLVS